MISLPPQVPPRLQHLAHVVSAYNICLRLEDSLQKERKEIKDVEKKLVEKKLVYIRILGFLIHHIPSDRGVKTVVYEISSSEDNSALLEVGKMYYNHYMRACTFAPLSILISYRAI
jgi:hypothetical protein